MAVLSLTNRNGTVSTLLNGRGKGGFDPFADLLSAQAARPAHLTPMNLRSLTPFQRDLVSIDGTVTKFIEAYMLEPVESVPSSSKRSGCRPTIRGWNWPHYAYATFMPRSCYARLLCCPSGPNNDP